MRERAAWLAIAALLAVGCSGDHSNASQLLGLNTYLVKSGYFEGKKLVRLDPATLRPLPGAALPLGDSTGSGLLSPDGTTLALGGANYSEIMLVDLRRLKRVGTIKLAHGENLQVRLGSWPRSDLLIALATRSTGKYVFRNDVFFVNPRARRVLRRVDLHGGIAGVSRTHAGDVVVLVEPLGRLGPARLVTASPDLRVRSLRLTRIRGGGRGPLHLGHDSYTYAKAPGLALDPEQGRALVVGAGEPIAEVDLRSMTVRYHAVVGLSVPHLAVPPLRPAGTNGAMLFRPRQAVWIGNSLLGVAGYDTFPVQTRSSRWLLQRDVTRTFQLVDTRTWNVVRSFPGSASCRRLRDLLLCSRQTRVPTGLKDGGDSVLVAYELDGRERYRTAKNLWWGIQVGRLFAGHADGSHLWELNPATGRRIRDLGSTHNWVTWPEAVRVWRPPN